MKFNKEEDLINNDTMVLTRKQLLKQKTIDIYDAEQFGYGCNIEWF